MDITSIEQILEREMSRAVPVVEKTAACSGCGFRHPRRELIELHEDNHDNLTYFDGDELCRKCADSSGVVY